MAVRTKKFLVLVVEDHEGISRSLLKLVEKEGHDARSAASVKEGMEALASKPSHLLLDMNLPDGLGTTILRHVRENKLPIKVAVISGTDDGALLAEAASLRPDAFFRKPPNWNDVVKWIAEDLLSVHA